MYELNLNAVCEKVNNTFYVKNLELAVEDHFINVRLLRESANYYELTYDVYVGKSNGDGKPPSPVVRDWMMRGNNNDVPFSDDIDPFKHRACYGGTAFNLGGASERVVIGNMLHAIFDNLLGSCDTRDAAKIKGYVSAAQALYNSRLVGDFEKQYKAAILTRNQYITGMRTWRTHNGKLSFVNTLWTYHVNPTTRMTHMDSDLTTTYDDVVAVFADVAATMAATNKVI